MDGAHEKLSAAMGAQNVEIIPNVVKYCSRRVFHNFGFSPAKRGNVTEK